MKSQNEKLENQLDKFVLSKNSSVRIAWKQYHLNAVNRGVKIVELFLSIGFNLRGKRVLDIGCGTCGLYNAFANYESDVVGIDVFKAPLKVGKTRISNGGFEVNLIVASGEHLPFRDNLFDVVLLSDVIEHTDRPSNCVEEISHVLDNCGLLYATAPNFLSIPNFLHDPHYKLPFISLLPPYIGKMIEQKTGRGDEEIKMFTLWSIVKLLKNQGFHVFIGDDTQTKKKFTNPNLAQSKIRRLLLSIFRYTRTEVVAWWLMRIFYSSVYQFLCAKEVTAIKDIDC
jgi:2-polyprenyl-3-methyl-5-hydroxy-6-metoxy-1,4-benzoquinol methylase